jgi:hypothetical protein
MQKSLTRSGDMFPSYQLIRGVLAAHTTGGSFCVFCDARRPDLIENWYSVMSAVRSCALRCRLQWLTWQERTAALPKSLRNFLAMKYGIARRFDARTTGEFSISADFMSQN